MIECSCNIKTNLDKAYFSDRDEEYEFQQWMDSAVYKQVGDIQVEIDAPELEGINTITASINQAFDYNHELDLSIDIDTELDEDTIADYDELFAFMDEVVVPQFMEQFNATIDFKIPVTPRDDFDEIRFDDGYFYAQCYSVGGDYKVTSIKTVNLQLTEADEVVY